MLECLVKWPGIADRENIGRGLAPRPGNATGLFDTQANLDFECRFDARADDFAISLDRMTVSEREQSARNRHGEPDRGSDAEPAVIHVTAVLGTRGIGKRLAGCRRNAETADHGLKVEHEA